MLCIFLHILYNIFIKKGIANRLIICSKMLTKFFVSTAAYLFNMYFYKKICYFFVEPLEKISELEYN